MTNPAEGKVLVAGLGNVLMGDDGAGPTVVELLKARYEFPSNVEVEDLGTPGLDLIPYVAACQRLVLIDTVRSDGAPGEVRKYDKAALLQHGPAIRVSPHDPGVKEALFLADMTGNGPSEACLVGIIPQSCAMHAPLSAPVQAALDRAVDAVVEELARLQVRPTLRQNPPEPNLWWRAVGSPPKALMS